MTDRITGIVRRELDAVPDSVESIAEGLLHETYEICCGGDEYVLQFAADTDDRRDALRRGLGWYVLLGDSSIPVPGVVTEDVREFDGRTYSLVEKRPGTTGERDVSPARTRAAGRLLAKIHDSWRFETAGWTRVDDGEPAVRPFRAGIVDRRRRKLRERTAMLREAGLDRVADELARVLDRRGTDFPGEFQPVLCHDDFSPDNVLFDGAEVTGVLDFDRARADHAQRDLVQSANAFWMHDPTAGWNVRATFYDGYSEVTDPGDSFEGIEPLYRVTTLAKLVAGMLALDELSPDERAFYAERLLAALDRLEGP